jgi:citrate synthase
MTNQGARSGGMARLQLPNKEVELPIVIGTEDEHAIDITKLRGQTGYISLDEGYRNTGSVESQDQFHRWRERDPAVPGIPIEQLAEHSTFIETALLLIYGELPTADHLAKFRDMLIEHENIHEGMRHCFQGFPRPVTRWRSCRR